MSKKESIKIYETVNKQSYIGHINFNPPPPSFPFHMFIHTATHVGGGFGTHLMMSSHYVVLSFYP